MRWVFPLLCVAHGACAWGAEATPVIPADGYACDVTPGGAPTGFRHVGSSVGSAVGEPRHRGIDLIAVDGGGPQTLAGKLAYTTADKDLEDEDVDLYACRDHAWQPLGRARTDGYGRFAYDIPTAARLAIGSYELYARVPGDGTGVRFYGYVLPAEQGLLVSDVDGTLTASENAIVGEIAVGSSVAAQAGAAQAFVDSGAVVVYLTARGDQFTELTRAWLDRNGFPRGPLRLAPDLLTLPGDGQFEAKTALLATLPAPVRAAVGNRATDVAAYGAVGLAGGAVFAKLPEFSDELAADLDAHRATGFTDYSALVDLLPSM